MDNGLADTVGEGEGGTNWESTLRHTQDHVYNSQWEVKCLDVTGSSALDDLGGGWGARRRGCAYLQS